MATISRFSAVATVGRLRLSGFVAWLMWLAVHLFYITGFKNQVTALLHWAVTFIGNDRSERTATEQQIFAREALRRLDHGTSELVSAPTRPPTREDLEARALEEARLTDTGARGRSEVS
jgi:NADH dehydrogenase